MSKALKSYVWKQDEIAKANSYLEEFRRHGQEFLRIGAMLWEFKEEELYLLFAESWGEFIEKEMGWSRQRNHQLLDAYEVAKSLPEECQQLLTSESHARALKPVPVRRRMRVIKEAQAATNGAITAKAITEAAEKIEKNEPTPKPPPAPEPKKAQLLDRTGWPVPETLVPLFERSSEVKEVLGRIASTRGLIKRVQENRDPLWRLVNYSDALNYLDRAYAELKLALPFAVCPYCQGWDDTKANCTVCKQRGAISQFIWDTAVDEQTKSIREKSCKK